MDMRLTPDNITVALLLAATLLLVVMRFMQRLDVNWPLLYYLALAMYLYHQPGIIRPGWVYAGVVCALFLRFEIAGGKFLILVRCAELLALVSVAIWLGKALEY